MIRDIICPRVKDREKGGKRKRKMIGVKEKGWRGMIRDGNGRDGRNEE